MSKNAKDWLMTIFLAAVAIIATGIATGVWAGDRDALMPYTGLSELTCEQIQEDLRYLADRKDKREAVNTGIDLADALVTGAVAAGTIGVGYAVVPGITAGMRLPYDQIHRAVLARWLEGRLRNPPCQFPDALLVVE